MRIRLKADISGTRDGQNWPARGGILDVSDEEGAQLCRAGLAAPVAVDAVETAEASSGDVEQRTETEALRAALVKGGVVPAPPEPTRPDPSVPERRRPGRPRKNQA